VSKSCLIGGLQYKRKIWDTGGPVKSCTGDGYDKSSLYASPGEWERPAGAPRKLIHARWVTQKAKGAPDTREGVSASPGAMSDIDLKL
jgi:hypothetical protein